MQFQALLLRLSLSLSAFFLFVATTVHAAPLRVVNKAQFGLESRQVGAQAAGTVTCTNKAQKLNSHDCNVALLSLGPGGIAGAIQFLRPNVASVSATSGVCKVTAATTDGSILNISKGRLEHGGVKGFDNLLDECGATPGTVLIEGGATGGGNTLVTISAA